ncbi:DNA polymerase I protein [Marine Group I thaumarchaeote SCGC AAA799-B03]|uniref:DNA polymerase n=4 Tax=Marine Group I TaxID=905826 RepID=A0A087S888_9ARCH|nr:DNA polymerase I protein [Marine Group I thaumarchaeote SCGC AAA799-N04]KFM15972.1 DNA polymerase I protein [Marine Group I thaumarchaeote SCGC AAA799-D11]KFM17709.1 DNA polymerase I protein [Marine Group I thaumarchaeote SCGC RSA3]KFM21942.1 DNA polymerase I protein [Marine Group I thaumarchaeote SCGC AAA799-B03]
MQVNIEETKKIESMPPAMLVSATYDNNSKSAVLKFYEPESQKLFLWKDEIGHKPYCYSRLAPDELEFLQERDDVLEIKTTQRYDLIKDKEIDMSKITVADPLAIGGTAGDKSIRNVIETWESDIKYYENYLYDRKLIVGKYYEIKNGKIQSHDLEISDEVKIALKSLLWDKVDSESMVDAEGFKKFVSEWADLLNQPIPKIKRLSVDIEVEAEIGRIPDPKIAEKKVTAIGMKGTDGFDQIFVLKTEGTEEGTNELDQNIKVTFYDLDKEKDMIHDAFKIIKEFPFVVTYNGDEFDLPYLYNRAERLGIKNSENPFYMMRDSATLKQGVHLDLYRTFSNRSFQIYAFSQKYTNFSLNEVSKALLGKEKIDYGLEFDELTLYQTANYCYNDALLTYELTSFNSELLMQLLVIISRIGRMPIDDIARMGVSQWIRSLLYYEHRKRNCLIPKRQELERRSEGVMSDAVIKDKKYRGGLVVEPKEGIHFDVVVMDFASLYPSIIKVKNLSYETVRCPHEECKKNKIPGTNHWTCSKKNGLTSMIIGSLRDLRVNYYKSLSKKETLTDEQRQQYTVVSQALKVILNASYGVMGAEIFPLYFLPAAEATTAIGRHTILETIKKCEATGIEVLYGDTDSLFIKNPTKEQIQTVIEQAKKDHGVDLEIDKTYRYCVLSNRKKNYLGVTKEGKVDVKGLTGKKSHTPPFIKKLFYELLDVLSNVQTIEDFKKAKKEISEKIATCGKKVEAKEIPLEDLTFNVMLSKAPSEYTKTIPQHIRAAKQLETIREIKKGDRISYIKILNKPGVKPVEMAKKEEIDSKKYMEFMESTLEQITSSMDLDFDTILGKPKQTGLDEFFWN